jgi:arginase family enzyme
MGLSAWSMSMAHCDTGDDYLGSRFHHGAPFRRAVEEGLIDPKRVVPIGIRVRDAVSPALNR